MNQSPNGPREWLTHHKKVVVLFVLLGVTLCVAAGIFNYYKTSQIVTITYDNTISSVAVWKTANNSASLKTNLSSSPAQIRLKKDVSYELRYKGAAGYADATVSFKPTREKLSLTADYSQEKYATMFAEDRTILNQMISAIDSSVSSLYTINDGTYYDKGKWYVTTLTSTQEPAQYFDTFMVVLGKTDGKWSVVVPPSLVANYEQYSSVPKDVLNFANTYRQKESLKEIKSRTVY